MKSYLRIVLALAIGCAGLFGQIVSSSLTGTVVSPANAVVADAAVTVADNAATTRDTTTDKQGRFLVTNLPPGTYSVVVKATGFKNMTVSGIRIVANETHQADAIVIEPGQASDAMVANARTVHLQFDGSGKTQTLLTDTFNDITMKGRDPFGYLKLIPGVIDTNLNRSTTTAGSLAGITIDGNTTPFNFTVDGVSAMETGSYKSVHYLPNLESIQELRVLTADYTAEFGRNSGGTVMIITKSGTKDFHGSGAFTYRHDSFNANGWLNNHTLQSDGTPIPRLDRYTDEAYGVGGPIYIPKTFNADRSRLFFFVSEEFTHQLGDPVTQFSYVPTANERAGNFTQSFNNNGSLILITDPTTGLPFSGNIIPTTRLSGIGQSLLNFFPLPNFTPTLAAQQNIVNHMESGSSKHPRRNDVVRVDLKKSERISAYVRWSRDYDSTDALFQGVPFISDSGGPISGSGISPIQHLSPGHGYLGSVKWHISPTFHNEITLSDSWNSSGYYTTDNYASESRGLTPNVPSLFPLPTSDLNGAQKLTVTNGYHDLLPTFTFGAPPVNSASYLRNGQTAGASESFNKIQTLHDTLVKTIGTHIFKVGAYVEKNTNVQPANINYEGAYDFSTSTSNPLINTGDGYVNALLGNVNSYTQSTASPTAQIRYYNMEFFVQDSWRVSRHLTIDAGVRFYHQPPPNDVNGTLVNFVAANYSKSGIARIYQPYCLNGIVAGCSGANRVARDPLLGATAPGAYIGDIVPGSGNAFPGMTQLAAGSSGTPYSISPLAAAPRIGFAWDPGGNKNTVVRGGFGVYYNRMDTSAVTALSGQAPAVLTAVANVTSFTAISALNTGSLVTNPLVFAPASPSAWLQTGNIPWDTVQNGSLDIQHALKGDMAVDLGATYNRGYNQLLTYDANYLPLGTQYPFKASNIDPTTFGATAADIGSIFERTIYPGYGSITTPNFSGHSSYTAFTAKLARNATHRLSWWAAYTFSKATGTTSYQAVIPNESWNHGRLASDRPHNLQVSYNYALPNAGKALGMKILGVNVVSLLFDNWSLSGITSLQSGAPFNPVCAAGTGTLPNYTGTPDLTARCSAVGNATSGSSKFLVFNATAFALPALATGPNNTITGGPVTGNLGGGAGVLRLPRIVNFDAALSKKLLSGNDGKRYLAIQAQGYNVFNHSEFNSVNSSIQFNPATGALTNASSAGLVNGTAPGRVLQFAAKLVF